MNATTPVLDDNWIVAVVDRIDAMPSTLADVAEPELVGRMDGEMGLPCQPLAHYIRLGDIESYIVGWKDATAVLADVTPDAYEMGANAYINGSYAPPAWDAPEYGDYLSGYNDAFATATNRKNWPFRR